VRITLVLVLASTGLVAGCPADTTGMTCAQDNECGAGNVCARDGECLPAGDVRGVKVLWTLAGQVADATTCAATPDFYIQFYGQRAGYTFGYEPVPCMQGQFYIDKLPIVFDQVELGATNRYDQVTRVDAFGNATFDLR
jgi:hypothetical protein